MLRLTVLYPNNKTLQLDFDYYINHHLPMSLKIFTRYGLLNYEIERGQRDLDGAAPPYLSIARFDFSDEARFNQLIAEHAQNLLDDIPNYANQMPQVQIAEVLSRGGYGQAPDINPKL